MKLYHIAALSENHVIGKMGKIPWLIKDDLRRFKEITSGHVVIMGRKTFESLGPHFPLKGRKNIILSSRKVINFDGRPVLTKQEGLKDLGQGTSMVLANSLDGAFGLCEGHNEVYVVGGSYLYDATINQADELRLTIVHQEIEGGNAFYPEIDDRKWIPSYVEPHETHTYIDYIKKPKNSF